MDWKFVHDNDKYVVNQYGEVKNIKTGKYIIGDINTAGYYRVSLSIGGKQKKFFRHRLVAMLFIPNPYNLPEVNHIDGDKSNNSIDNLEWCDRTHNEHECRRKRLKKYRPFYVIYEDGTREDFEFVPQLAIKVGVTRRTVLNWLQHRNNGNLNYGITHIEYIINA